MNAWWGVCAAFALVIASGCRSTTPPPRGHAGVWLYEAQPAVDAALEAQCELKGTLPSSPARELRVRAAALGANVVQPRHVGPADLPHGRFDLVGGRAWRCPEAAIVDFEERLPHQTEVPNP